MLKISKTESSDHRVVELKIEGKICGAWARELKQTCINILDGNVSQLILDFSSVISIDREGLQILKRVDCSKIKIVGCNMFLKDLIGGTRLKQCSVEPGFKQG